MQKSSVEAYVSPSYGRDCLLVFAPKVGMQLKPAEYRQKRDIRECRSRAKPIKRKIASHLSD